MLARSRLVLDGLGGDRPAPVAARGPAPDGSTDTVALVFSIIAMITAGAAVTLTVSRPRRRPAGA